MSLHPILPSLGPERAYPEGAKKTDDCALLQIWTEVLVNI